MHISSRILLAFIASSGMILNLHGQTNLNMELQDSLTYHVGVNDVNGWVAEDGSEYALVGLNTGVSIVNVDSDTIREVVFVQGANNLWRDINTFGHYAYVTSEARIGLLIIDLQYLPDSVQTYVWSDSLPTSNGPRPFEKAHTLFIDEYGIAYLNGSNLNAGGVVLIDVASNPTDPVFLGYAPAIYSHDVYARDSILYSAEIYTGDLSIYDVHDPANITLLGRVKTPNEFTHNAWLSDNSRYLFTTDERTNSYVAAYDIIDPANIVEVDRYRQPATAGLGSIPHNVYVWNDWLVVAYYTNGTTIVDASRPGNLIEVGSFDSYLGEHGGFSGVWGSYPFLPSGKILTSDRNSGLYVFEPNYVRAAFLEGTVIDSTTGLPIPGAVILIESDEIVLPETTAFDGSFKTGKAIPGTYNIVASKPGYYTKIIQGQFENGVVLTPVIELVPLPTYAISGTVINSDGNVAPFAEVIVSGNEGVFNTTTDIDGSFHIPAVYGGSYEIQAGIWGQTTQATILIGASQSLALQLERGYRDDFDLNLGWSITGDAIEGVWERGIPTEQILFDIWHCGADTDSPHDQGSFVYSTGLSATGVAENDEVSGGTTLLSSPFMSIDSIILPKLSFDFWMCEFPPNQYLGFSVWITNGQDTFLLGQIQNDTIAGSWQSFETGLSPYKDMGDVQILFLASDTTAGSADYLLKVHVDNFLVAEGTLATDHPHERQQLHVYPNPVNHSEIFILAEPNISGEELTFRFYDLQGRLMNSQRMSRSDAEKGFEHHLQNGIYILHWDTENNERGVEKIFVIR